jgi:hypothetical protein
MNGNALEGAIKKTREFAERYGLLKKTKGATLKILKMSKSQRKNFFESVSFGRDDPSLPGPMELLLIKENVLSYMGKNNLRMSFTFKGLMILEYGLPVDDMPTLRMLDELNNEYFIKTFEEAKVPLNGEEKAIIITFLGLMLFSPESSLKLSSYNNLHSNVNDFKLCVEKSVDFLRFLGTDYIDSSLDKIWTFNVRGEDPVNAKIARLNDISLKTDNIYHKGKKNNEGHFLDIMRDNKIDTGTLELLLKKVFDKGMLTFIQREKLISLLKDLFSERHNFVTDASNFEPLINFYIMTETISTFI